MNEWSPATLMDMKLCDELDDPKSLAFRSSRSIFWGPHREFSTPERVGCEMNGRWHSGSRHTKHVQINH